MERQLTTQGFPAISNLTCSAYKLKKMVIGTINYCYIVTTPNSKAVVRISRDGNAQQELSDRTKERKLLSVITERGAGVKLLAVFDNGKLAVA